MNATPKDWPRISATLFYQDPLRAIDWLCEAFGFTVRIKVQAPDGSLVHSELGFGDGLIMVAGEREQEGARWRSPRSLLGANTAALFLYVDDIEAHYARARTAGATVVRELSTSDYGKQYWSDRGYGAADPEGHLWHFAQRLRNPPE